MSDTTQPSKFELPTIIVIFGITGDLVKKKILKALYHLYRKKRLPSKFRVYGFSRRDYNNDKLLAYLKDIMVSENFKEPEKYDSFLNAFSYVRGDFFEKEAYGRLAKLLGQIDGQWSICSNKL